MKFLFHTPRGNVQKEKKKGKSCNLLQAITGVNFSWVTTCFHSLQCLDLEKWPLIL